MQKKTKIKFTPKQKEEIVKRYLNEGISLPSLAREVWGDLSLGEIKARVLNLRNWIVRYKETGEVKNNNKWAKKEWISVEKKLEIVRKINNKQLTIKEAVNVLYPELHKSKVHSKIQTIKKWIIALENHKTLSVRMGRSNKESFEKEILFKFKNARETLKYQILKANSNQKKEIANILLKHECSKSIRELCRELNFSRSSIYAGASKTIKKGRKPIKEDPYVVNLIKDIWNKSNCKYGRKMIQLNLQRKYNVSLSEKDVYRIMKKNGIKSTIRIPKYKRESKNVNFYVEDKIQRNFKSSIKNHKWFSDVSYIHYGSGKLMYISVIIDTYNNKIVSFQLSDSHDRELINSTLMKAIKSEKELNNLILHTDHGSNYSTYEYIQICQSKNITRSMGEVGNSLDNRPIEYFFSILKQECVYDLSKRGVVSKAGVIKEITNFIKYYNEQRYQWCLGGKTPCEL